MDLNSIRGQKWNAKHVIIFQTVILQPVWLVTGSKNIRARIDARLDSWNGALFDEIVCDSYVAPMGYLVRAQGGQSYEQYHRTF